MSDKKNIIVFTWKINVEAIGDENVYRLCSKIVFNYILYITYFETNYYNSFVYGFLRNKQKQVILCYEKLSV